MLNDQENNCHYFPIYTRIQAPKRTYMLYLRLVRPTVVAAGDDMSLSRMGRETVAVAIGRVFSYRRLSAWR